LPGGTEEDLEKRQSEKPTFGLMFEIGASRIRNGKVNHITSTFSGRLGLSILKSL